MSNCLDNGDFSEVQGNCPLDWKSFGYCEVFIADEKFQGKNVCRTEERTQDYSGIAQNVTYIITMGKRYKFKANVKLTKDVKSGEKHKMKATLQYNLSNNKDTAYLRLGEIEATSDGWVSMSGRLNMPRTTGEVIIESATLYFEGPEPRVNFLVADVELIGDAPPVEVLTRKMDRELTMTQNAAEVFISYQWGIQEQVKKLKNYLESKGLTCWMDIGQMGGGDSLYGEIDAGVRGAKVVLCCVTEKYAKSQNCSREVSLADGVKKPIIPLLWENMAWPPAGAMSMVFAPMLFIKMVPKPEHKVIDGMPEPKLDELMSEIRQRIAKK